MFEMLKQIVMDPFNTDALSEALKRVEQLQAENDELRSRLPPPNPMEPHPESLKYASEPFRVRRSMRDRKAKAEAKFNRVYRNIKLLNDDLVAGEINVPNQIGQDVRRPLWWAEGWGSLEVGSRYSRRLKTTSGGSLSWSRRPAAKRKRGRCWRRSTPRTRVLTGGFRISKRP